MSRIRVAVAGAKGRMGSEVVRAVNGSPDDMELVAQIDAGDDLAATLSVIAPDVLVDFTIPDVVMPNIRIALAAKVIPLVGTTGLTPENIAEVARLCDENATPALIAPNFALGAVLMMRFAQEAARHLPDVEIIEMHHEKKLDAPSGTAKKTAEMIADARGGKPIEPQRIHSVRLPGFVASQEVIFGGAGQRLSIRHDSIDRASFMPGVLLAIRKAASMTGLVYGLENLL